MAARILPRQTVGHRLSSGGSGIAAPSFFRVLLRSVSFGVEGLKRAGIVNNFFSLFPVGPISLVMRDEQLLSKYRL